MAVLPSKLVERLNNLYELGEFKFGKELQKCLTEISNNPSTGACLTIPSYSSQAAAEAACGKIEGNTFFNSTTNAITYCDENGWVEIDYVDKCEQVDQNTTKISINMDNITTILNQITMLQSDFDNHTHDGVNSQPIDIKNLITTAPAGQYFFSTGSGIDCGPITGTVAIKRNGSQIDGSANCLDFLGPCFAVTQTAAGAVSIDIPDLPGIKSQVTMNAMCCTDNTTAISNLSTTVVNIQNQVTTNTTDIGNLQTTMANHCHDGTDSAQIRIDKILSEDGPGSNIANNFVVCADGSGGWNYVDKATLAGAGITLTNVGPGEDVVASTSTSTNYDIKGITAGCGIAVTSNATDINVAVDFAGMPNVGTALDINTDTILVHDASTNTCVQTSLQSLVSAVGAKDYLAGKALTRTVDGGTGDCTFDVDLTGVTPLPGTDSVDDANDYILFYDASEADCRTVRFEDFVTSKECCLPDPGGLNLLDPVYIDPVTGSVTAADVSDPNTVAQYVVVGFKTGQVCIQDFGTVNLDAAHGFPIGECVFEGPGGTTTTTQPNSGINNSLFHAITANKLSITAGTRAYQIGNANSVLHFDVNPGTPCVSPKTKTDGTLDSSWFNSINVSAGIVDAGKMVELDSIGKVDKSFVKGVNQYPGDASAVSAGINTQGCMYFNTVDEEYKVYLNDPCGNGSSPAGFQPLVLRKAHFHAERQANSQTLAEGVNQTIIYNTSIVDNCSAYNAATGVYTVPDSGVYMVSASGAIDNTQNATDHQYQITLNIGPTQYVGQEYNQTQFNNANPQSNLSLSMQLNAGDQIFVEELYIHNQTGVSNSGIRAGNYFTVTRLGV